MFELVGIFLKKLVVHGPSQSGQYAYALEKGSTILNVPASPSCLGY